MSEFLRIEGKGIMEIVFRKEGIVVFMEGLFFFFFFFSLNVWFFLSGSEFKVGLMLFYVEGDLEIFFKVWWVF